MARSQLRSRERFVLLSPAQRLTFRSSNAGTKDALHWRPIAIRNWGPKSPSSQQPPALWSCVMFSSPSIVPDLDDRDIYLVLDEFEGRLGRAWRETDKDRTDREIVITDL